MKDSFVFYKSFFDALQDLKDKDRLKVYDAICNLALNDEDTKLSGIAKTIFTLIKPQVLANKKRYENGKKGGRPKKETNGFQKIKTNGFKSDETKTKPNENVNENENVNVNENGLGFSLQHKRIIDLFQENGILYFNTPVEFNIVRRLVDVEEEMIVESIEDAKIQNKCTFNYVYGVVRNKLREFKKVKSDFKMPTWFDEKIEKDTEGLEELNDILKDF
ncbi:MAG: hypothetical protein IJ501_06580 [Bacilli bacterium]|nr:hypothetical protein [Bacilli bacterium]